MGKFAKPSAAKVGKKAPGVAAPDNPLKREAENGVKKGTSRSKKQKVEEKKIDVKAQEVVQKVVEIPFVKEHSPDSEKPETTFSDTKKTPTVDAKGDSIDSENKDAVIDDSDDKARSSENGATDNDTCKLDPEVPTKMEAAPVVPEKDFGCDDLETPHESCLDMDARVESKTAPNFDVVVVSVNEGELSSAVESSGEDLVLEKSNKKKSTISNKDELSQKPELYDKELPDPSSLKRAAASSKASSPDESGDDCTDESDDEEPQNKKIKSEPSGTCETTAKSSSQDAQEGGCSSEEDCNDYEEAGNETEERNFEDASEEYEDGSQEEDEDTNVEMTDAIAKKSDVRKGTTAENKQSKTPVTSKDQTLKTIFVGNLPFSIRKDDLETFLQAAGEIVDLRFPLNPDGKFRGFAHADFASTEAAEKAVQELNGRDLQGRTLRIDLARERGSSTPQNSGKGNVPSIQKGDKTLIQTVFVRGFDINGGEDEIRKALDEHFGACGEISRISIPIDQGGSLKGIAYLDFKDEGAFSRALGLNGSEFGDVTLKVEKANARNDGPDRSGRDARRGGRFGNGGRGGRGRGRFGNGGGGRFGAGGRGRGDRFGAGGRGRGDRFGASGRGRGDRFGAGGRGRRND